MIEIIAFVIVILCALYFLVLGAASFIVPVRAARFLLRFADSAQAHYLEMSIRLIVGGSLIAASPRMQYSSAFHLFGWVLVLTALVLMLLPWRWHQRFARKVVPPLTKRMWSFGMISLLLGAAILFAALT